MQAEGDADRLAVLSAVAFVERGLPSALAGEDTDLPVLLTVLLPPQCDVIFLKPGRSGAEPKPYGAQYLQTEMSDVLDVFLCFYTRERAATVAVRLHLRPPSTRENQGVASVLEAPP